ncbi:MAG: outer membrane lipoprotein-sorting protein [Proteobacteria bacterium]|nr:outer membrane lipoprotein-sorting protein [Pseudomonadota bacterium]
MSQEKQHYKRLVRIQLSGLVLMAIALNSSYANAIDPNTKDPRKIIQAVQNQKTGDKQFSRITMTVTDNSRRKKERVLQSRSMKFDKGAKTLMLFESPADVRNIGLLIIDYDDVSKEDDQWLYLPSLHKSTRISSSDRSGSFLGTDITYADMTRKDVDAYNYKLLKDSVFVDGEECWLIEARPKRDEEINKTGYLKSVSWVSKQKLIPIQAKMWIKEGRKLKYIKSGEIEKIDGIWVTNKLSVRTVKNNKVESETVMKTDSVQFNQASVKDSDFTERRLERGL